MLKLVIAALTLAVATGFQALAPASSKLSTKLSSSMPPRKWNEMVDPSSRSTACPWLPRPIALDGTMIGDVGFDPLYLSSIPKNFAGFIQPPQWESTEGIDTLYWMREAELKHGRITMLAWFGWLAADGAFGFPLRFPAEAYHDVPSSYAAHDIMVSNGSLGFMLGAIGFVEVVLGAVLVEVSKGGSDREAGDYGLDPLNFLKGKSPEEVNKMKLRELKNGRLAMLAFAGVVTQCQIGHTTFPYIS
ncbi:hypothetical protein TrST_g11722 [Triparma strigata]|uniref:Chlorophyll a-b binding protein, chloroplastic n=1 Tax=Triparma strigata TaxID=1606541 RepID=A0A9W7DS98_9STRA|nr:hypothetical protein TrST_g11722 [Triparma strigata]